MPAGVTLRIQTSVRGAQVFVDGERRGSAGEEIRIPVSDGEITVTVKAPGHRTWTRVVTPRADIEIEARLVPRREVVSPPCLDCLLEPK